MNKGFELGKGLTAKGTQHIVKTLMLAKNTVNNIHRQMSVRATALAARGHRVKESRHGQAGAGKLTKGLYGNKTGGLDLFWAAWPLGTTMG